MNSITKILTFLFGTTFIGFSKGILADWNVNLRPGVTKISREVYDMHMMVFWICVSIGILVFSIMFFSVFKHRQSKGVKPATFHHSMMAEVVWTIIPFFILIAMAIPAAKALIKMEDTSHSDMTIKITGHQWKWEYEYLQDGIHFFSNLDPDSRDASILGSKVDVRTIDNYLLEVDKPLVLPVGKKIRVLITSNDVIHSWWMPDFAVKKDAVPGFINEMWFKIDEEGTYRGQCAELCGKNHGYMPIVVKAVSENEYNKWIKEQVSMIETQSHSVDKQWNIVELMEHGKIVYNTTCAVCHQIDGQGISGVFPSLSGSQMVLNDAEGHINIVLNGVSGTAMQSFKNQLNDLDIAALITYERNAWGNDTGDIIQPSQIKELRSVNKINNNLRNQ